MYFKKGVFFCIALAVIFYTTTSFGQTIVDSSQAEIEQIDTVRVKKKIIVNKTVYAPPIKKENVFFIGVSAGLFADKSYYKICESCKAYFNKVEAATSDALSYNYGIAASYSRNKLYFSIGLIGSHYRQKFKFTDSLAQSYSVINELKTVELNALGGYWFRKDKNGFSYMVLAGASYASLYDISGSTLDQKKTDKVVALKDEIEYYPTQVILTGVFRVLYPIVKKIKIHGDFFYGYDLKTIIKTNEFVQQRNMYGFKLGCLYTLQ